MIPTSSFSVRTDAGGQSFQGNRNFIFSLLDCRDFGEKDKRREREREGNENKADSISILSSKMLINTT